LPICQVRDLEYSPQTKILAVATHGRGVWEILTAIPNVAGQISGNVYNDLNANGQLNTGEPGLQGWVVFRDDNNNGLPDDNGTTTFNAPGTPVTLPDQATTTSTLTVSGQSGVVTDVNVKLDISHPSDSDLQAYLTSPAGTKVTLFANIGGMGQNFTSTVLDDEAAVSIANGTAPFTGSFQPQGLLGSIDGQTPNGTWTLTISDTAPLDSGTLNSWSIMLSTGENRAISQSDGNYILKNNSAGTYTIRRVLQPGWTGTEPASGSATVTLAAGQGAVGVNFGQIMTLPAKVSSVVINNGDPQ